MIGATLFSGIGAPETAMPEWQWAWCAEIEAFPCAVLKARHPQSVNLGDVAADDFAARALKIARPDVLVFGSPCQSFSVAGKRLGLDDPRGNLALVALGIVDRLKPRWFVFENVPGLLSSDDGRDFGTFVGQVDELRYSGAWASLDAQYRGLAQRRNRLFFVGYLGDWRGPAAVLLEPESLCGDSPPRREAGQGVAHSITTRAGNGSRPTGATGNVIAPPITSNPYGDHESREGLLVAFGGNDTRGPIDIATAVNVHGGPHGRLDFDSETFVAYQCHGTNVGEMGTLRAGNGNETGGVPFVAFSCKDDGADASDIAPTLRAMPHDGSHANAGGQLAVAFNHQSGGDCRGLELSSVTMALQREQTPATLNGSKVRRLIPEECEALQGYWRGYTAITYRGKPAADGPRYKALGNSMAVPVMRWILTRIELFEQLGLACFPLNEAAE